MKKIIFFIFIIQISIFANKLDLELFGNMTKIKIAINANSKVEISENYFKRYINIKINNYPKNFKKQLLAYADNIIDTIEIIKETQKELIARIYISKINFFYDYRIEDNNLIIPIGIGLKIVPLKTNHNLIFVPYFFDIILPDQEVENLKLSKIYSINKVAQEYNNIIDLYEKNNYKEAKEKLNIFIKTNIDKKSLTLLKYLDAELDYRLKKEDKRNCNESIIKFKELIAENPNNPYNDRAVVFMYLCSKENDALSDSKDMIKKVVNEYTNSPYYNRFLYEDALNDYDNGRNKKFIYKLKTIIKTSKNYELKLYAIYKMYGFYLKQYNVAEAYELIIENAQEYSKYSSYPISPYFFISFGDALFFNREFAKAREIYENVIKLTPNISLVKYAKVRISDTYLYQYDYQKVEEYFKKNKDFFNEKDIGSQLAQIRVAEYEGSFYEDDKLTQKFNIMQQYLKDSTLREELIFREAQIYFYKEDYLYAYLKIKKLLNDYPKTTLMMTAKEMIDRIIYAVYLNEYLGKKYTRIYQLYADNSEIIKLHPEYFNLAYIIMNSLNELEQYDKLIQLINYILTKKLPQNLENVFLYKVAYAYLNKGNYYKAIHAINYIKIKDKRFKNNFKNYKFLGDYYWKMKKYKLSIRNYNKALSKKEMDKESKIKINNKLSNFFFKKRAYSPALRYYIESNKIKENNEILLKIGEIYYYMGEYDKVIVVLNKFLIKNKNNDELSHVYYKIGNSWIKKGKYDKGIFILEDFVKKQEANKTEDFWLSQIKDLIKYEKYKNKLNKLKEININRSGL